METPRNRLRLFLMNGKTVNEERLKELDEIAKLDPPSLGDCLDAHDDLPALIAAARRCNELEAERDALKEELTEVANAAVQLSNATRELQQEQIDTLRADNAALREAAHFLLDRLEEFEINDDADDMAREFLGHVQPAHERLSITLASTPADSLREYRNGVKEK